MLLLHFFILYKCTVYIFVIEVMKLFNRTWEQGYMKICNIIRIRHWNDHNMWRELTYEYADVNKTKECTPNCYVLCAIKFIVSYIGNCWKMGICMAHTKKNTSFEQCAIFFYSFANVQWIYPPTHDFFFVVEHFLPIFDL